MEKITDQWEWSGRIRSLLKAIIRNEFTRHTSWEIQTTQTNNKEYNKNIYGKCCVCSNVAIIRFNFHGKIIGRYCEDHKACINVLRSEALANLITVRKENNARKKKHNKKN